QGILSWIITGLLMIFCALQFASMSTKYNNVNGVVDYAEATCGRGYAYYLAWFMTNIYYPGMTSVLAWVSARYFGVIFGWDISGPEVMALSGAFLIASFVLNSFSPKIAGKLQISATVIKLIPIVLMAVVGTIVGTVNGTLPNNFEAVVGSSNGGLFSAIVATVFAYEGWVVATSINAELKNPRKNLPIALVVGSLIVVAAYVLYFVGVAGGATTDVLIKDGSPQAFKNIFGGVGGTLLNVCIVVSCLGTLNGLMVAATRGMYSIAVRGEGPAPKLFSQVDSQTNMTTNSSVWGLMVCMLWLVYFYGANLAPNGGWFGLFNFDSSELPIVTIYAFYVPMIVAWMVKEKDEKPLRRFVLPILSLISCLVMVFSAFYAHGITPYLNAKAEGKFVFPILFYMILFALIMIAGFFCSNRFKKLVGKQVETVEEQTQE
ncbi:MAG: APC family permease, partial [Clostridia bacterium]|nr:APC family permease [Clostridia bacterium]